MVILEEMDFNDRSQSGNPTAIMNEIKVTQADAIQYYSGRITIAKLNSVKSFRWEMVVPAVYCRQLASQGSMQNVFPEN